MKTRINLNLKKKHFTERVIIIYSNFVFIKPTMSLLKAISLKDIKHTIKSNKQRFDVLD